MIGYVTLGSNDVPKAAAFYDALLADVGAKRTVDAPGFVVWGVGPQAPSLGIAAPHDGGAATVGNGVMVALYVGEPARVSAMHARALALGGTDEGAPGPRADRFFSAYCRDLDGNKLNFFCMAPGGEA